MMAGNCTAPVIMAPWTFIAAALECETMTQAARLESLSVASAMLGRTSAEMPKVLKANPERG
jgi:hypothetical protein